MDNQISKVRVVTKNFIYDSIASIKNMFGVRINYYEDMISKAQEDMWDELRDEGKDLSWYRYEITELTNGAIVIMLYGEVSE